MSREIVPRKYLGDCKYALFIRKFFHFKNNLPKYFRLTVFIEKILTLTSSNSNDTA
jgi:hypothetical protein